MIVKTITPLSSPWGKLFGILYCTGISHTETLIHLRPQGPNLHLVSKMIQLNMYVGEEVKWINSPRTEQKNIPSEELITNTEGFHGSYI